MTSFAVVGLLAACGSGDSTNPDDSSADGKTELTVVSLKPGSEQSAFDAFDAQVAQFEAANPDVTVTAEEYDWTGPTFAARLAGDTLPDVYWIPFTNGQTMIENGQLADIDAQFRELPYADSFAPNVLAAGQAPDGKVYGIPWVADGMGLQYNRALFEEAGLDPDQPPTTWDEVREDAKVIADATGQAGYATMSQGNTGGWQLMVATYAHGGRAETVAEDGTVTATLDNDGTRAALEFLQTLRWEDNSMGSNFLYDSASINQAFAAGQVAMYTGESDTYDQLKVNDGIDPADYGLTVLPLVGDDAGILAGGELAVVNVSASEAVKDAAVRWIDFYYLQKLTNEDAALQNAATLSAAGLPVGTPTLPIFDQATYEQALVWVDEYINIPTEQVQSFYDGIFDQQLISEPPASTQELYATLDTVVQAVLTDPNADIDALLAQANADVQAIIDQG